MSVCKDCKQPIENTTTDSSNEKLCSSCISLSEHTNDIYITPMKKEDLELVLAWRSNPKIYKNSREQSEPLDWENHVSWYESRDPDRHDFVIHYQGRRVGVVSISETDEISIYLGDFSAHGKGIATAALSWICDRFKHRVPLVAQIHQDNTSSVRLFEKCGFQQQERDSEWKEYYYEL